MGRNRNRGRWKMYRKKSILILVMLALSLALIPSVYAAEYPIDNIVFVLDLPENLVAGNTYVMIVTFDNVAEVSINIVVEITVTCEEAPLNIGEIIVESIYLNEGELFCTEVNAGVFSTEWAVLEAESSNEFIVTISSLINLMPGIYKFDINLLGDAKPPVAEAGGPYFGYEGRTIKFDGTGSLDLDGEIVSYEWDFGDGKTGGGSTPSHIYSSVGTYTVTLTVTDDDGLTDSDTATVTVSTPSLEPAVFVVTDLAVSPSTVHPNDNVAVRVVLANVGEEAGEHELELFINGIFEASETVTLEGGVSTIVTFTVAREDVGVYLVKVHGLQVSFTVIPEVLPIPAEFIISNLAISPSTVHPGDDVTVTVVLANVGEEAGVHEVELLINGTVAASEPVTLGGGESTTVTFTVVREDVGVYMVEVDGLQGSFTVIPEVLPIPAEFIVKALTISPATAYIDETVTVRVEVENVGEEAGEYTVELLINGVFEASEPVALGGGELTAVTFTVVKDVGAYLVEVDGLQGSFTVIPEVQPIPAEFEYSNLSIAPTEVEVGELVNVSVTVTNVGELEGVCDVSLIVNGTVEAVESVTLIGGEVVDVIFTLTAGELGTYIVSIDGLEGIFTVVAPPTDLTPYLIGLLIIIIVSIILFRRLKK